MTLRIERLTHRFGRRILFENLEMELTTGQWLAITGRNGSGKTTLVRILAGLTRPTRGAASLIADGKPLVDEARRNAVGLVTPDLTMDAELTARETLRFHAIMRGVAAGDENALLEKVGLSGRGDDRVRAYSSGMRQRLKYAFAIQRAPSLLLLDEPTANLDSAGAEMTEQLRAEQLKRGILVVATNDPVEAEGATHLIRLGEG